MLLECHETRPEVSRSRCVHEVIERAAERWSESIAVVCGAEQMSFGLLNRRANQLGRYLRRLGVGPEVRVGIYLERSVEMVLSVLAVLKAGGAYVPLDPGYPLERVALMLEDASVALLLTQEGLEERLPAHLAHSVRMDADWPSIAQEAEENIGAEVEPGHAAYVIYTSGSTGKPKGVVIEHGGVCNLMEAQQEVFNLQPEDRVFQFASLSFDVSVWEMFATFQSGATLCLGRDGASHAGAALAQSLRREAITMVTLPPSVLMTMPVEALPAMEKLVAAAEVCPAELVERWAGGRRFFNAYGPTEITVCATVAECSDGERNPPIGRPLANVQVYVLDQSMEPRAPGAVGELFIGGEGVARGYLDRPEQTAERFVPDSLSGARGGRLYRTGDLVRFLEDGNLEYVGRLDHQVKIRGFRIELGEIETVLRQHPQVREAVILASDDGVGQRRLVAYVVGCQEAAASDSQLRDYMQKKLPAYMVPAVFVRLDEMPLNLNGKIDRHKLPAADNLRPASKAYAAPRTDLERALANIWQEVLQVPEVSVHDNFFELGGDSLLLVQVHSQLTEAVETNISIMELFQYPSISSLAQYMSHAPGQEPFVQRSQSRAAMRRESMRRRNPVQEAESAAWNSSDEEDTTVYKVVVNHEEQYSIWPESKVSPSGWRAVGTVGRKAECLAYIKEVWTDMMPLSLKQRMEERAKHPSRPPTTPDPNRPRAKSLVDTICEGIHRVEASLCPEKSLKPFKEAIDRNYLHITFTDTRGGTTLGVGLDPASCDFRGADFEHGTGTVHVEGGLTLDCVKVRCIADIDLATLEGKGHLVKVEDGDA